MKLFQRILCLAMAMLLTFALCACGNNSSADDTNKDNGNQTTTTTNDMGGNLDNDNIFNDGELTWD